MSPSPLPRRRRSSRLRRRPLLKRRPLPPRLLPRPLRLRKLPRLNKSRIKAAVRFIRTAAFLHPSSEPWGSPSQPPAPPPQDIVPIRIDGHIGPSHRISCPPWDGLTIAPAFLVLYPLANTCQKSYTIPINIRQSRKTHVQAPAERGVVRRRKGDRVTCITFSASRCRIALCPAALCCPAPLCG